MRTTILIAALLVFGCDYPECLDPAACEEYPAIDHVVTISASCVDVGSVRDCGLVGKNGIPIVACADYDGRPVGDCTTPVIVANSGTDHSICATECP
jgi:hypothetical protein